MIDNNHENNDNLSHKNNMIMIIFSLIIIKAPILTNSFVIALAISLRSIIMLIFSTMIIMIVIIITIMIIIITDVI